MKAYAAAGFARALVGATGAAALGGCRILGLDAARCVLATAWIEGRSLCPSSTPVGADTFHAAGRRLAELHAAEYRPPFRESAADDVASVVESLAALDVLRPALARQARPLARATSDLLAKSTARRRLVHGDFSADQVVIAATGPLVIDWDRSATGDPARDVGTFLARLEAQALDGTIRADEAERAGSAFLEGYAHSRAPVSETLPGQTARALLALLTEGFRLRRPDWPERAERLLARAESVLSRGGRS